MKLNYGFEICEREESGQLVLANGWTAYAVFDGSVWERYPNGWSNFPDLVIPSDEEIMTIIEGRLPSDEFIQSILDEYKK